MTAAGTILTAATEGLALERTNNSSGFRNVSYQKQNDKYDATLNHNGEQLRLGFSPRPKRQRCASRDCCATTTQRISSRLWLRPPPLPMTAAEAIAAATTEGLTLESADDTSGFQNVSYSKKSNKYDKNFRHDSEHHHLCSFPTPEEAVLCVA